MTPTIALWLIPLAVIFYGIVCWAIGWQMRGHADEVLPDARINPDAEGFPSVGEYVERNHVRAIRGKR